VAKTNYQSESVLVGAAADTVPTFSLSLLRDDRTYNFSAKTTDGQELNADVTMGGKVIGHTPLRVPLTFQRPSKASNWPKFDYSVEIPAKYKAVTGTIDYASMANIALKLEPIVEIATDLIAPALVLSPTGIEFKSIRTTATAVLSTREATEIVSNLKPVTDYQRKDLPDAPATRAESINSFCVSPDGQNVIFSLTERDEDNNLFSNLFIKRSDDAAGGVARLTQGNRYWDTLPYIANDGSNYLVFASNRSDRTKPDIFRVSLVDNRLSGGISRLTNDNRFNYSPSYGDSNRQLFYLSTEPNFPKAESVVSSIRMDGSLPTQMAISALEVNNTFPEKVFFVRLDKDTKTKQIYSITADGKLETALINQEDFRKSNCYNPAISANGNRILFVSDQGTDDQGRHNNDIYVANKDGTGIHRITQNGSDDIMPAWSPEEGVIYFLSNRGGAYNIWRAKLSTGTK
jgi:Tol biopolymer transport system component